MLCLLVNGVTFELLVLDPGNSVLGNSDSGLEPTVAVPVYVLLRERRTDLVSTIGYSFSEGKQEGGEGPQGHLQVPGCLDRG